MKRITKVVLILTAICLISVGAAAALFFMNEDYIRYSFDNPNYKNVDTFEKSLIENITDIEINSQSSDVFIKIIDSDEVTFNLTGYYAEGKYDEEIELSLINKNNKIIVDIVYKKPKILIGFNNQNIDLYVEIPKNYSQNLDLNVHSGKIQSKNLNLNKVEFSTDSGRINFEDVLAKEVLVESKSGSIYGEKIDSEKIDLNSFSGKIDVQKITGEISNIKTTSGNILLNRGNTEKLIVESFSGRIEIENFDSNEAKIKTTSGGIDLDRVNFENSHIESISGSIEGSNSFLNKIKTSSGRIELSGILINKNMDLKSSSGRISIDYLPGSSFNLMFDTNSGRLDKDFEGLIFEGGDKDVLVQTNSGSLSVNRF